MKRTRFTLLLCLLLCITTTASASFTALDGALAPLLGERGAVNMSVTMTVNTLMPFDDTHLELINRVLRHTKLEARMNQSAEAPDTVFRLALGYHTLMEFTEQNQNGSYLLQSTLLPNRVLFSEKASPMDALLAAAGEEAAEPQEDTGLNTSDVEEAFDMLAAVQELEGCYRTLIDQTVPLTKKNTPNYRIENIGRGRISYVAKLTTEQSGELLDELRAVISCGMDTEYREELSKATFAKGFVVALYQNEDGEDICVYIKGTVIYPDGDERALKWQWAFTPDRETQTFLLEVSRENGTRDSRVINAILEQTEDEDSYAIEMKASANLRRSSLNETSTLTMDITGGGDPLTCKGDVTRVTKGTSGGESTGETETNVSVDLTLNTTGAGSELAGTAVYRSVRNDTVQTELELTFSPSAAVAAAEPAVTDAPAETKAPAIEISIIPADPGAVRETAQTVTVTVEETQTDPPEFLVGAPPLGLYDYEIPPETMTINMDDTQRKVHQSLMNEAAQRLAGNLLRAMLDLSAEDRELLSDGMTESDYAIFLAMLD